MTRLNQTNPARLSDADRWIEQIFSAKAAQAGGVVRRAIPWIDREVGRARFIAEVRKRNFHLLQTTDQFIVVCNNDKIRMLF